MYTGHVSNRLTFIIYILKYIYRSGEINTDGDHDATTFTEINEEAPTLDIKTSSKKRDKFFAAIPVFVVVMMVVLVATCACVIIALVQIAALQQNMDTLHSELGQNVSQVIQQLRTELDRNTEELRQNYSAACSST